MAFTAAVLGEGLIIQWLIVVGEQSCSNKQIIVPVSQEGCFREV